MNLEIFMKICEASKIYNTSIEEILKPIPPQKRWMRDLGAKYAKVYLMAYFSKYWRDTYGVEEFAKMIGTTTYLMRYIRNSKAQESVNFIYLRK